MLSLVSILHPCRTQDIVAEIPAEVRGGPNVCLSPEDVGQFPFDSCQVDQSDAAARLKFDQHIDVTVGVEVFAENRAKQRELSNMMLLAESLQRFLGNSYLTLSYRTPCSMRPGVLRHLIVHSWRSSLIGMSRSVVVRMPGGSLIMLMGTARVFTTNRAGL